jgi:hypothetical protein
MNLFFHHCISSALFFSMTDGHVNKTILIILLGLAASTLHPVTIQRHYPNKKTSPDEEEVSFYTALSSFKHTLAGISTLLQRNGCCGITGPDSSPGS